MRKRQILAMVTVVMMAGSTITAMAAPEVVPGTDVVFDASYYAESNPDVVAALGTDRDVLVQHYLSYGAGEGRAPYGPDTDVDAVRAAAGIAAAEGDAQGSVQGFQPVPMGSLANLSSLRKKTTDAELKQAYDVALETVTPYANLGREDQLMGIAVAIRNRFDQGMSYSTDIPHYNDPYGYFVLGVASCAGCTRATGLCLNILGIPYEHVNENQWGHQWCRVNINGTYWICDAFGLYCGPEPAPYQHPYL